MKTLIKQKLFAGKFEIQGEIAKGQTGTILYGYDLGLRQEVAIKVYHSHINSRMIRGKAFVEKSKPLLRIDHPNLIKIFKVEEEEDIPVIFMEFFDAPSLQQMLRNNGPLPIQDMLILAQGITEVLVHAHLQGIIHGTLHPGHVLVGPQGQIKVLDLGLSWALMDSLSNYDEELLRPLPYFPPEIAKGELLNISSDVYCLGFMMYEMLTGTVPYAGLPKTSIMGKLAFDQADPTFDFPDTVPEAIRDLIRKMTHNKAQQRLQDATHVLTIINQQLSKLSSNKDSSFLPPSAPQPQAPVAPEPAEPKEISAPIPTTPQQSDSTESAVKKASAIRRPQKSLDYSRVNKTQMSGKIGITVGLFLLLGIAGALGYWYRDLLEPHIPSLQTKPEVTLEDTSLPITRPGESNISITPAQDSLTIQEPLSETDEPAQKEMPSLVLPKKPEREPLSGPASLAPESDLHPDQSKITRIPKTGKSKQETSLVTTGKQPQSKPPTTSVKAKPSKILPTDSGIAPLPATKTTTKQSPQKVITQQPEVDKATPLPTQVPTLKQPEAKQSTRPEKQSSEITPIAPESTPAPKTQAPKEKPVQASQPKKPVKETNQQKNSSTSSIVSSEKSIRKPVEKETKALPKTLGDSATNVPSITEP